MKTPQIIEMYEKGTVLLQLLMAPTELYSFKQMKKNEFLWQQNVKVKLCRKCSRSRTRTRR